MARIIVEMTESEYDSLDKGEVFINNWAKFDLDALFRCNVMSTIKESIKVQPGCDPIPIEVELLILKDTPNQN